MPPPILPPSPQNYAIPGRKTARQNTTFALGSRLPHHCDPHPLGRACMHEIIDVAQNVEAFAEQLANAGAKTVIRYYNHSNSQHLPTKALTRSELDRLHGAGLSVAV